ncbi:hypothetical protein CD790_33290 [Streptomyces sp. SAJ15]|nr:hypothetical protein CD790_33290 [Streptomyces sp. SAJ15]
MTGVCVGHAVLAAAREHRALVAALPGKVEFCQDTAGTTRFNQSPYHAWKAGFQDVDGLGHLPQGRPPDQLEPAVAVGQPVDRVDRPPHPHRHRLGR